MKWSLRVYNVGTRETVTRIVEAPTHREAMSMMGTLRLTAGQWVVISCTADFVIDDRSGIAP